MKHTATESRTMRIAGLTLAALLLVAATPLAAIDYEYDPLGRLIKVTYDNGNEIAYEYDAAGNIIRTVSSGRDHRSICATLEGRKNKPDADTYRFVGVEGEPVTVRLQAEPREAGAGKRATLTLLLQEKRSKKQPPSFSRSDDGVLPNEITATLPQSGVYLILVEEDSYSGDYCLTLEASPDACASFEPAAGKGKKK